MSTFFLIWDIYFTYLGVWGFNEQYLTGIGWAGLPIEEYLFFLLIGFCCLFLYESMNYWIKIKTPEKRFGYLFIAVASLNLILAFLNIHKAYTFSALGLNGLVIFIIYWLARWFPWKKFFVGYIISFIPFTIVNGILTGGFTPAPVVWYNEAEILGYRIFSIPIEDSQYMMLMMTLSIVMYEWCKRRTLKEKILM